MPVCWFFIVQLLFRWKQSRWGFTVLLPMTWEKKVTHTHIPKGALGRTLGKGREKSETSAPQEQSQHIWTSIPGWDEKMLIVMFNRHHLRLLFFSLSHPGHVTCCVCVFIKYSGHLDLIHTQLLARHWVWHTSLLGKHIGDKQNIWRSCARGFARVERLFRETSSCSFSYREM